MKLHMTSHAPGDGDDYTRAGLTSRKDCEDACADLYTGDEDLLWCSIGCSWDTQFHEDIVDQGPFADCDAWCNREQDISNTMMGSKVWFFSKYTSQLAAATGYYLFTGATTSGFTQNQGFDPCVAGCNARGINFGVCTNAPAAPDNGSVEFSDADNDGSVATFTCDAGAVLDGEETVTCTVPLSGSTDWPSAPSCTVTMCSENQRVSSNACTDCEAGTTNPAGDNASGADTTCESEYSAGYYPTISFFGICLMLMNMAMSGLFCD